MYPKRALRLTAQQVGTGTAAPVPDRYRQLLEVEGKGPRAQLVFRMQSILLAWSLKPLVPVLGKALA